MHTLRIFPVSLIITSVLLTACGGGTNNTASEITPSTTPTIVEPNTTVTPKEPINISANTISLLGLKGKSQVITQQIRGIAKPQNAIVDAEFSNAKGEFSYKANTTNAIGNLTFSVEVEEPDQIVDISIYLPDVEKSIALCSTDCGTTFNKTITSFSPQLSGAIAGDLRVELFVTDSAQNTAMLDAFTVNWQPISISAVTATRSNDSI